MATADISAVTAWGTVAGAAFLGVGALAAWIELRRGARARETRILLDLVFRWLEQSMVQSMHAMRQESSDTVRSLIEKLESNTLSEEDAAKLTELQRVANFFETIGYLERNRSAITVRDMEGLWGTTIIRIWKLWEPSVTRVLRRDRRPVFLYLELLATKVDRYRERRLRRERLKELFRAALPGLPKQ
jgi:hypothetical protein